MTRRTPFVAGLVALPVLLGGCGLGEAVVGIHDAPAERSDGASVTEETARDVASRVLDLATDHHKAGGAATTTDRTKAFSGPALREARAAATSKDYSGRSAQTLNDLEILGISRGHSWPRAILATSQVKGIQYLHVLVAEGADQPYSLFADVPMAAGSSVPALAPVDEGSPVTVSEDPDTEVAIAATAWAKGVTYPPPTKEPTAVSFEDAFSTALRKNAEAKDKDLDDLATYRQRQSTVDAASVSFDLAEGGQLTFLPMTRTDTITAGGKLKELKIEDEALEDVLDASTVERALSIKHAETLALVTPESGKATVVGVSDVLRSAKGS